MLSTGENALKHLFIVISALSDHLELIKPPEKGICEYAPAVSSRGID